MGRHPLPNVFIVGAPRCGTTSLYTYLAARPGVYATRVKEPHTHASELGTMEGRITAWDSYEALFAAAAPEQPWVLEASVLYLYSESARASILSMSPGAMIVVCLRNPVDLVESWHRHLVSIRWEPERDLRRALELEEPRRDGDAPIPVVVPSPFLVDYRWMATISSHLERWQQAFGPDRVRVVVLEQTGTGPGTPADLCVALGIGGGAPFPHLNRGRELVRAPLAGLLEGRRGVFRSTAAAVLPHPVRRVGAGTLSRLAFRSPQPAAGGSTRSQLTEHFAGEVTSLERLTGLPLGSLWA